MLRNWRDFDNIVHNVVAFAVCYFRDDEKYGEWGDKDEGFNGVRLLFSTFNYAEIVESKARSLGYCVIMRYDPDVVFGRRSIGPLWGVEVRV